MLLAANELSGLRANVWMGGAHSHVGDVIGLDEARRGWFVDCAGEMPVSHREAAFRWTLSVFADLDGRPPNLHYLEQNVREMVETIHHATAPGHESPEHIYVMCHHGMNRSGLVAGMLLRALGMPGDEAVRRITSRRPGALSNLAFRGIVLHGP